MMKTCENCRRDFLTEADMFVYQNTPAGEYYSCGCVEFKESYNSGAKQYTQRRLFRIRTKEKLELVGNRCEDCGISGDESRLVGHHLDLTKTNHDLDNLRILCQKCHLSNYHKRGRNYFIVLDIAQKVGGYFTLQECYRMAGAVDKKEEVALRVAIFRMCKDDILLKHKARKGKYIINKEKTDGL